MKDATSAKNDELKCD